jgi:hypothetical protein
MVSPDGKFYWDGQRWLPMHQTPKQPPNPVEGKTSRDLREIALVLGVITLVLIIAAGTIFLLNRGPSSSPAAQAGLVRADPKTLVAQGADFPSYATLDPIGGGPSTGQFPAGSGITPIDAYSSYIGGQGLTSLVALYGSVSEAQAAYRSIKLPSTRRSLDFSLYGGLKVGEAQQAYSWDLNPNTVEVDLYWRSGNVIAFMFMTQPTSKNYPTLSETADSLDNFAASVFATVAPRVQTRIRLAAGS